MSVTYTNSACTMSVAYTTVNVAYMVVICTISIACTMYLAYTTSSGSIQMIIMHHVCGLHHL